MTSLIKATADALGVTNYLYINFRRYIAGDLSRTSREYADLVKGKLLKQDGQLDKDGEVLLKAINEQEFFAQFEREHEQLLAAMEEEKRHEAAE